MEENNVNRYLNESCKSFRDAKVKNSARRNSLMKKTLGIENERRMANAQLKREERQLREQLKLMKLSHKPTVLESGKKAEVKPMKQKKDIPSRDVDPYPVTFCSLSTHRKGGFEEEGRRYASRRHKRVSHEFEDLHVNTSTGKLRESRPRKPGKASSLSPMIVKRLTGSKSISSSREGLVDNKQFSSGRSPPEYEDGQLVKLLRSHTDVLPGIAN